LKGASSPDSMPASITHSMLTEHPKWFENQTSNRPPDGVNSISPKVDFVDPSISDPSGETTRCSL
ncbi:hypothetical protein, partial [Hydrogenophaga sp.]|uniref:hypothetical protein n=1 Tax=Hydrogenophaga sp. TaxID=1904254 RepID=UPI002FC8D60D